MGSLPFRLLEIYEAIHRKERGNGGGQERRNREWWAREEVRSRVEKTEQQAAQWGWNSWQCPSSINAARNDVCFASKSKSDPQPPSRHIVFGSSSPLPDPWHWPGLFCFACLPQLSNCSSAIERGQSCVAAPSAWDAVPAPLTTPANAVQRAGWCWGDGWTRRS